MTEIIDNNRTLRLSDIKENQNQEVYKNSEINIDNGFSISTDELLDDQNPNEFTCSDQPDASSDQADSREILNFDELRKKTVEELLQISEKMKLHGSGRMLKQDMVFQIMKRRYDNENVCVLSNGVMEVLAEGYGFLRSPESNYVASSDDVYVSAGQIKKFSLRTGDIISGEVRAPTERERYFTLTKVHTINFTKTDKSKKYIHFDDLIPVYPNEPLKLERKTFDPHSISMRAIDIMAPLGKGQRALIVAPPRSGKTILMQQIANSITENHPEVELIVLLIAERPEEVTDMQRSVKNALIVSSTFDDKASSHVRLAEMVSELAKRMVEQKKDVVILVDSLTRLARAYNSIAPSSGKVLTGGVDSNALQYPKKFFGAARNIENGGSLTIIATILSETGSKMDDVIHEEFKSTGNADIILNRGIAERGIFPAIEISKSGTRKVELLMNKAHLHKVWVLRRILSAMSPVEAMEFLRDKLLITKDNDDFFDVMNG